MDGNDKKPLDFGKLKKVEEQAEVANRINHLIIRPSRMKKYDY